MQKQNKKRFSLIKVVCICLILILLSGAGVMAVTTKINSVQITLSDGYQMTILSSKTKVEEILEDNNIILAENETVTPSLEEEITESRKITITDKSKQEIEVAKVSESEVEMNLDTILNAYNTITEKIETVEESIPYETVTKDVSSGSSNTKNKVLQEGEDGLKRVTYKVKYQDEVEIERNMISEEIIKEPVQKIIQVQSVAVSSRSSSTSRSSSSSESTSSSSGTVKVYKVTAYCSCSKCCGSNANGYTASGTKATAGRTVAAPSNLAYGTTLKINGNTYVVEDRGGSISGNRLDIYVNSHAEALAWGVKYLPVEIEN